MSPHARFGHGTSRARIPAADQQTGYSESAQLGRGRRRARRAQYHLIRREHHPLDATSIPNGTSTANLPTGALRAPQYWLNMTNLRSPREPQTLFRASARPIISTRKFFYKTNQVLRKKHRKLFFTCLRTPPLLPDSEHNMSPVPPQKAPFLGRIRASFSKIFLPNCINPKESL